MQQSFYCIIYLYMLLDVPTFFHFITNNRDILVNITSCEVSYSNLLRFYALSPGFV